MSVAAAANNPLLNLGFAIPFDRIAPEHIEPAIQELLEQAEAALVRIETSNEAPSYANSLGALEAATERLERAIGVVGHLESVATTPDLRAAYNAVQPEVSAFYARIPLRPVLWQALKSFAQTDEAKQLDATHARFLKKTLDDFRRNGADLDEAGKARLQAISRELAELTNKFGQNVVDATAQFELLIEDEKSLSGLPESAIALAREDAARKGKSGFRFTLQAPSLIPLLTYLDDGAIRRKMYHAHNTRATSGELSNVELMQQIIALRREQAKLLGYSSFPDFVLEDRMAKNYEAARRFVDDLTARAEPAFARETAELTQFFREMTGDPKHELLPSDLGYAAEKLRKQRYDFDEEQLRPYFALDKVVEGLFETARRLYGVRIERNAELPTWHPEVQVFDIFDESGAKLAAFYADFHPRDEKRGGAWMNHLITGMPNEQGFTPHLGLICTNVSPPAAGKPALLTHAEVTTLFHEFGHLLHHCLSRVNVRSLAGTNVAWDFVELPSQIMENWCWERAALDTFALHYETGEKIPQALFDKMLKARTFRAASATMRQLGFATVDLALHVSYQSERDRDLLAFARDIVQRFAPAPLPKDYGMIASFGHLFSSAVGYASGYYSYKWAEVLDADAFTRFETEGVFNRQTGEAFRRTILERGDSDDPAKLYRDFMGREPQLQALLQRAGLS
ncbi:MAG TPA: M3 family metallopeptidase [Polyangiaceae bacterium]|nr:M3 family metallopeptidase [Polyangiaceae bacterium]